jgi:hypothetical protein
MVEMSKGLITGSADGLGQMAAERPINVLAPYLLGPDRAAEPARVVSGRYFYHRRPRAVHPAAADAGVQDAFLDACAGLTGVALRDA